MPQDDLESLREQLRLSESARIKAEEALAEYKMVCEAAEQAEMHYHAELVKAEEERDRAKEEIELERHIQQVWFKECERLSNGLIETYEDEADGDGSGELDPHRAVDAAFRILDSQRATLSAHREIARYAQHKEDCVCAYGWERWPCSCGLSQLMAKLDPPAREET